MTCKLNNKLHDHMQDIYDEKDDRDRHGINAKFSQYQAKFP